LNSIIACRPTEPVAGDYTPPPSQAKICDRTLLDHLSPDRLSRQLRRLRDIGVIKRVAGTYRYYLTRLGRAATAALCRVTESIIIPAMA
jgi:DNA-binding Lrp family transcriptional regulator